MIFSSFGMIFLFFQAIYFPHGYKTRLVFPRRTAEHPSKLRFLSCNTFSCKLFFNVASWERKQSSQHSVPQAKMPGSEQCWDGSEFSQRQAVKHHSSLGGGGGDMPTSLLRLQAWLTSRHPRPWNYGNKVICHPDDWHDCNEEGEGINYNIILGYFK